MLEDEIKILEEKLKHEPKVERIQIDPKEIEMLKQLEEKIQKE